MNKTKIFLWSILVIILSCVILGIVGVYFNFRNIKISPLIIQNANSSALRIISPIKFENVSDSFVIENLIKKFVYEYFYVIPSVNNIETRKKINYLYYVSSKSVLDNWIKNETPYMIELANKKIYRDVIVVDEILKPEDSDYYEVRYNITEWNKPNELDSHPSTINGILFINLDFEKGLWTIRNGKNFNINKYLKEKKDPSIIFKFRINEVKKPIKV